VKRLLLMSGPVAVGKSSVAVNLMKHHKFDRISTSKYLTEIATKQGIAVINRTVLQEVGDALDEKTDYRWVVDDVAIATFESNPSIELWLLDSVRKERQVQHFRERFGPQVFHVHLTAPETILRDRYETRRTKGEGYSGNTPYDLAIQHSNEVASRSLIRIADTVIDVVGLTSNEVAQRIITRAQ